jgi:hypothetical protein
VLDPRAIRRLCEGHWWRGKLTALVAGQADGAGGGARPCLRRARRGHRTGPVFLPAVTAVTAVTDHTMMTVLNKYDEDKAGAVWLSS